MADEETNDELSQTAEETPEPSVAEAAEEEPVAEAAEEEPNDAEPSSPAEPTQQAEPAQQARRKRKRLPRAERRQRAKPKREPAKTRAPLTRLPKPEPERGRRQERRGVVVSHAMDKTIVVRVETLKAHPRYKKIIRRSTKLHAHDERNEAKVGDVVRIVEARPISKTKRWRLAGVIEAAK